MADVPWPPGFEVLLRKYLRLDDGQELTPDLRPVDHGLASVATVSLLLDLEATYSVVIPDEQLARLGAATVGELWAILAAEGATG